MDPIRSLKEPKVPLKPKRKQKPFTREGKQDMTELLDRIEDRKALPQPCPLGLCVEQFTSMGKDIVEIKTLLHGLLGNGQPGTFQKLEQRVSKNERFMWMGVGIFSVFAFIGPIVVRVIWHQ